MTKRAHAPALALLAFLLPLLVPVATGQLTGDRTAVRTSAATTQTVARHDARPRIVPTSDTLPDPNAPAFAGPAVVADVATQHRVARRGTVVSVSDVRIAERAPVEQHGRAPPAEPALAT